jgi:hypothetical protein
VRNRKSSALFRVKYAGFCGWCGRAVETGQMIQCHRDFNGVVHTECRATEVVVRAAKAVARPATLGASAVAARPLPPRCPDCYTEPAGECL